MGVLVRTLHGNVDAQNVEDCLHYLSINCWYSSNAFKALKTLDFSNCLLSAIYQHTRASPVHGGLVTNNTGEDVGHDAAGADGVHSNPVGRQSQSHAPVPATMPVQ